VSLDGMVGKGIRVLSSWVGFSCLVVRAWLLLVLFLLVGLSCPLRCLRFSFFSWCAWWHCFLRWSSCLVLLGSFSGSFLVLRCPCALVCGLLPLFFLAVPLVCLLSACFGWLDPIDAGTVLLPSCLFGFLPCGGAWSVSAFSRRSLVSFLGSVVLGSFSGGSRGSLRFGLASAPLLPLSWDAAFLGFWCCLRCCFSVLGSASLRSVLFLACPASVVRYGLLVLPGGLRVGSPGPGRGLLFLVWMDRWVLGRCDGKE